MGDTIIINDAIEVSVSDIEAIAKVCHEANRAYCETQGDNSQPDWEICPDWQRKSAIDGVIFHLNNPDANAADSHNNWMRQKQADGWMYGPIKDADKKEHPCMMPYESLPVFQQTKDFLFKNIVHAFRSSLLR
jgi:hypothetical protein